MKDRPVKWMMFSNDMCWHKRLFLAELPEGILNRFISVDEHRQEGYLTGEDYTKDVWSRMKPCELKRTTVHWIDYVAEQHQDFTGSFFLDDVGGPFTITDTNLGHHMKEAKRFAILDLGES